MPSTATPTLNRAYICPGDRVCAAVSGGADSVAMLLLLQEGNQLPQNGLGIGLSAVHIHHGIRGEEADKDRDFVRKLCGRLDIPLRILETDVPARVALARTAGAPETLEEAARNTRYELFRELLISGKANVIATAHSLEDQAETVLMKLLRGAWTEGLAGIFPVVEVAPNPGERGGAGSPGRIVRPLLEIRRADLRTWLEFRDQPWREDSTNQDEAHTRNRLRHTVMPLLRRENPALDRILAQLATLAREDETRWNQELTRILPQLFLPGRPVRGGGRAVATGAGQGQGVAIELERLRSLDPALRRRVLRAAGRQLGCRLGFEDTERLLSLAGIHASDAGSTNPSRRPGKLDLPGGVQAERSLRELRIYRSPASGEAV